MLAYGFGGVESMVSRLQGRNTVQKGMVEQNTGEAGPQRRSFQKLSSLQVPSSQYTVHFFGREDSKKGKKTVVHLRAEGAGPAR